MAEPRARKRLSSDDDDVEKQTRGSRVRVTLPHLSESLLLSVMDWLAVADILAVGGTNQTLRALASEEMPWNAAARHLWKSALLEGVEIQRVEAAGLPTTARAADLTPQDICRCMVGAWPTFIDRHWEQDELIQAMVDGVFEPLRIDGAGSAPDNTDGIGGTGGGGGGSGGRGSNTTATATASLAGLCTGVAFRGRIGGDRAVRANIPFPLLGTIDVRRNGAIFRPRERDFTSGCVVMARRNPYRPRVQMRYPDEFLARVKEEAPFAFLWPGHAAAKSKDLEATSAGDGGSGGGSGGRRGYGGGGGSSSGDDANGELQHELEEIERLPGSGPAPFFHAGYTAYFEISLGEKLPPLQEPQDDDFHFDSDCVAIGLARDRFKLEGKQPGWDRHSWGFHSDDGFYHHRCQASSHTDSPTTFGPGDTVGCGLLYPRGLALYDRRFHLGRPCPEGTDSVDCDGAIFFTKNGRFLGIAFNDVDVRKRPLYPVIGLDSHCCVTANFGAKAFAFDLPAFETIFTGASPSSSTAAETSILRRVYSRGNGVVNPRLLCPYIRLTEEEEEEEEEDDDIGEQEGRREEGGQEQGQRGLNYASAPTGASVATQSEILRRSLNRLRAAVVYPYYNGELIGSSSEDSLDSEFEWVGPGELSPGEDAVDEELEEIMNLMWGPQSETGSEQPNEEEEDDDEEEDDEEEDDVEEAKEDYDGDDDEEE